ncbi:MAG: substrate-binding domain-containing protein [Oscillospiraceae bacterium]
MAQYLYLKIYNQLRKDIAEGIYNDAKRLPTEKQLSEQFDVSRITSRKALTKLFDEGVIVRHSGIGSILKQDAQKIIQPLNKKIIGLVIEAIWGCYGIGIFDGAYQLAQNLGYTLILKKSYGEQQKEIDAINELIALGASGILISPVHGAYYNEKILQLVVDNFPIVFIDRYLNGINVPYVGSDNLNATILAVDTLVANNHKNIAFITTGKEQASTLEERKAGYIAGLMKHNISEQKQFVCDQLECVSPSIWNASNIQKAVENVKYFLVQNPEITGIIASEYDIATIFKEAATQLSKTILQDMELICFDSPHNYMNHYEFTHISQNEFEIGRCAVEILYHVIQKDKSIQLKTIVPSNLIVGNSTK